MTSSELILELKNVTTIFNVHTPAAKAILKQLNLKIYSGDFITVLGPNGAGKSTFFNSIAGTLPINSGQVLFHGKDITRLSVEKRAKFISRVFQDPKMGTAPRMTVAENLLLATKRGKTRGLRLRRLKAKLPMLQDQVSSMNNGLAEKMKNATESLSGGQRQALSFLMATIARPDLLLLDEHTAALDPKTSAQLMKQTNDRILQENLTCLMITHHLDDALRYGNRLLVLNAGKIVFDVRDEQKEALTKQQLLDFFGNIES